MLSISSFQTGIIAAARSRLCGSFWCLRSQQSFGRSSSPWAEHCLYDTSRQTKTVQVDTPLHCTASTEYADCAGILKSVICSNHRRSCWQVRRCGDRPQLSAAAREQCDITGSPSGVCWMAHPVCDPWGVPRFPQPASVSPQLLVIIRCHMQNCLQPC